MTYHPWSYFLVSLRFLRGLLVALGGDAYALWGRALIARARRSPKLRKAVGSVALLLVGGVALLILNGQHQEALRKQEYEQQQKEYEQQQREAAQRQAAQRQAEEREAAQRQAAITAEREAAITAQREAAQREAEQRAAARRAAIISARDLSFSNVTLQSIPWGTCLIRPCLMHPKLSGTITNNSTQTLRTVVIELTVKDCPPGTPDQGCRIVGQDRQRVTLNIPPAQARSFEVFPTFGELPPFDPQRRDLWWRVVFASSCTWFPRDAKAGVPWCEDKEE
jgi:hypothetical protein